jgi:hypothetical protein
MKEPCQKLIELPKWEALQCVIPYAVAKPVELVCGSASCSHRLEFLMHNFALKKLFTTGVSWIIPNSPSYLIA